MRKVWVVVLGLAVMTFSQLALARTCFNERNVQRFQVTGDKTLEVVVGNNIFRVTTGMCMFLHRAWHVDFILRSEPEVCKNDRVDIYDSLQEFVEQCRIVNVERLN